MSRVARGDKDAVRECLARYGGLVWSLARRHAKDDAEDAVQEIFLDVWRSAVRFDPQVASESAFVAMIARRRLIDRARRNGRQHAIDQGAASDPRGASHFASDEVPASASAPSPEVCAEAVLARRALSTLRPEQQKVLLLSTCSGLSHDEIASHTGMPIGTVKAHIRRGLMRVRAMLLGVKEEEPS
jgi:RNA polymerase sigma-70 factor (ECF subfamily)